VVNLQEGMARPTAPPSRARSGLSNAANETLGASGEGRPASTAGEAAVAERIERAPEGALGANERAGRARTLVTRRGTAVGATSSAGGPLPFGTPLAWTDTVSSSHATELLEPVLRVMLGLTFPRT
jgi:hypothetical protein